MEINTKMKSKKILGKSKFITIILILIFVYLLFQFYQYSIFLNNKTEMDLLSQKLSGFVTTYINQFGQEDLTSKKELNKMDLWLKKTFYLSEEQKKILNYGYEVKYLKSQNLYLFCLYGADKKKSLKNISNIKEININSSTIVSKPSFINYLLNFSNYDNILFAYHKYGDCYKRQPTYRFYNKSEIIYSKESEKIKYQLKKFELINKNDFYIKNRSVVYFKYNKPNIEILCQEDFNNIKVKELKNKLQLYFDKLNLNKIDYGIFPININK